MAYDFFKAAKQNILENFYNDWWSEWIFSAWTNYFNKVKEAPL